MLAGGDGGPVVVPGDAAKSRLLAAVRHEGELAMPPDGRLSADEIAVLESWVAAGVPWSGVGGAADPHAAKSVARDMSAVLAEAKASHWSFQTITRHAPPALPEAAVFKGWDGAIDRFIAGRLVGEGIEPSPPDNPRALHRRLTYDLTGLAPSADEADAFVNNPSEQAYRDLVERLLDSREHAEHWARKWLDLARYADTMGYAFDNQSPLYPFAWTYRDWVIEALQRDVPYDRFVTLQIAADRLQPPVPKGDLAALGFLTVGRSFLGNGHDIIDDRIDLVTRGLMGLTVACARCHDHKYEPVSAADYYALHGIFDSCVQPEEMPQIGEAPDGPEAEAFSKKLAELRQSIVDHEKAVHARGVRDAVSHAADYLLEVARPKPRGDDGRPPRLADGYELEQLVLDRLGRLLVKQPATHPILGPWMAVASVSDDKVGPGLDAVVATWGDSPDAKTIHPLVRQEILSARPRTLAELAAAYARLAMRVAPEFAGGPPAPPDESADNASLRSLLGVEGSPLVVKSDEAMRIAKRDEQTEHRRRKMLVTQHLAEAPGAPPHAMVLVDRETPHDSRILLRGNPGRPGDVVKRRLPMLLGGAEVPSGSSGRLELAQAIASTDNPLTPRVIVNWVWTHHFGRGFVETPGDLGLRGEAPSHPELLDDLARRFVEEGAWSLRWLHREIVTSRTFRQASTIRPDLAQRDPDNRLFARANRRRLSWEAWRDSLLEAAGTLDPASSGVEPELPRRRGGRGIDPVAVQSMGSRSVYATLDRQDVPGIMRVFDIANPDTAVHVRSQTSVPQQSLAALNAPIVVEAARRVADRVGRIIGATAGEPAFVHSVWRTVLARSPSDDELAMAVAWLEQEAAASDGASPLSPRERLAHALLATAEFQYVD
ncbi:MAG: PSD1 and planctomycete cytochrome C domain-containing protein, partial [Planctomycetaceae bacterium]